MLESRTIRNEDLVIQRYRILGTDEYLGTYCTYSEPPERTVCTSPVPYAVPAVPTAQCETIYGPVPCSSSRKKRRKHRKV
jgi:hypothetical protein